MPFCRTRAKICSVRDNNLVLVTVAFFGRQFPPQYIVLVIKIPLPAEQRVLGFRYIMGTYHDRTFCLLWTRVIRLTTCEPFNTLHLREAPSDATLLNTSVTSLIG